MAPVESSAAGRLSRLSAGATLRHARPLEAAGGPGGDAAPVGTLRLPPFGVAVLDGTLDRPTP